MNRHVAILRCVMMILVAIVLAGTGVRAASADEWSRYQEYKKNVLADKQEAFAAIVAMRKGDTTIDALLTRMQVIDDVAEVLVRSFEVTKLSSLKTLAADAAPETSGNAIQSATAPSRQIVRAAEILAKYSPEFCQALPKPALTDTELRTVRDYYAASAKAAGQYVVDHSQSIAAVDRDAHRELSELCLVIPLLHRQDDEWAQEDVLSLPDWLREPARIKELVHFAIVNFRPRTAYQFELFRRKAESDASPVPGLQDFVLNQAKAMAGTQTETAIRLLKVAMSESHEPDGQSADIPLRVYYVELLDKAGQPALAADEAKAVWATAKAAHSDLAGKAVVLRLTALCKAGQYDNLLAEVAEYKKDEACKDYLPQILYLHWMAARRQNKVDDAQQIEKAFLNDYPDHPLAADMHFAHAMTLLAAGDYAGASKVLELIESQFPGSFVANNARNIRIKLTSARKTN